MRLVEQALTVAPPGNAGWLLPVEPLLNVGGGARHVGSRLLGRALR